MIAVWILLGLLALFVLALVLRAARFVPKPQLSVSTEPVSVDEASATARIQAIIRCPTVSYSDASLEDAEVFEALPKLLETLYPVLHAACPQERIGARGLLYHWKGRHSDAPSIMMAHYDVVPAEASMWQKPPFDAVIEDGILWGRGTLDTKGTLFSILEAAEKLIADGFVPENDVYLAFGGNEEISGDGAPGIVAALKTRGVRPAFVLDEGGAVVEKVFPGVRQPAALVGIGEKGSMTVSLHVASRGGHASAPPPHTPVGVLSRAVTRVEGKPFPFRLTLPARALFDTLGRHSTFLYRLIFANLWCFAPLLNLLCKKTGGEMNALVRTTCAFTMMQGSDAANVLPPAASMAANLRIIGGETMDSVVEHLRHVIGDDQVDIRLESGSNPSADSRIGDEPWQRLSGAIAQTFPEAIISPYLMVAASDSRHYAAISDHVYRFCPMEMSAEERRMIHGNDERIPLAKLYKTIQFYVRLMKAC